MLLFKQRDGFSQKAWQSDMSPRVTSSQHLPTSVNTLDGSHCYLTRSYKNFRKFFESSIVTSRPLRHATQVLSLRWSFEHMWGPLHFSSLSRPLEREQTFQAPRSDNINVHELGDMLRFLGFSVGRRRLHSFVSVSASCTAVQRNRPSLHVARPGSECR